MKELRLIKYNSEFHKTLKLLYSEWWEMIQIHEWIVYLHREKKRTREEKKWIQTREYLEFREKYPSKTGIYDDKFIIKYNSLVKEWLHSEIMNAIDKYLVEIEVTGKKIANASTWINQKRWNEKFTVVKDREEEWMNELFDWLSAETIKLVKQKISDRKAIRMEINKWVVQNIINHYTGNAYQE